MDKNRGPLALSKCGVALYGTNWQKPLQRQLNVNDNRIKKWLNGDQIPEGVWSEIISLLKQKQIDIEQVLNDLDAN